MEDKRLVFAHNFIDPDFYQLVRVNSIEGTIELDQFNSLRM